MTTLRCTCLPDVFLIQLGELTPQLRAVRIEGHQLHHATNRQTEVTHTGLTGHASRVAGDAVQFHGVSHRTRTKTIAHRQAVLKITTPTDASNANSKRYNHLSRKGLAAPQTRWVDVMQTVGNFSALGRFADE